jgi:pullulanase
MFSTNPMTLLQRVLSLSVLFGLVFSVAGPLYSVMAQQSEQPDVVNIPGTIQSQLGCPGDWQPDCAATFLTYDEESDIWSGEFNLPAGSYEYKTALNLTWGENYGLNARRDGPNIPLSLPADAPIKFYYDHKSHWITDSHNSVMAVAVGDFQQALGCSEDNDPTCLRSWLQDPEGSGLYTFATTQIPPGTYTTLVAINENLDETYGEGGQVGGSPMSFTVSEDGDEVYFGFDPESGSLLVSAEGAPRGSLGRAQAHWVTDDTILLNVPANPTSSYTLHHDPQGGLRLEPAGIVGGQEIALELIPEGPSQSILRKFPHLSGFTALRMPTSALGQVGEILKGQLAVSSHNERGRLVDATRVQIPGVLDYLYTYNGPLGVTFENAVPVLRVWAPTARSVELRLFADPGQAQEQGQLIPMTLDAASGVWSATGSADWKNQFYLYEVEVFVPLVGQVERNFVTDPYSFSLSTNSKKSQIVDLNDSALIPSGWDRLEKPDLDHFTDIVVYELHVRDFSAFDPAVPEEYRGKFMAFTVVDSNGMRHLRALAEAGLTHLHLLPIFDIATIEEDPTLRREPDLAALEALPPDSDQQQALIDPIRDQDAYNWGYDPYHFTVPEGSYSTNPNGPVRILEFREMVKALNQAGLRVVMDVVYNHTNASGQSEKSVLDRIVPGYYHRLNQDGFVETSTCCQNTATEHNMMRKLMVDSVLTWSTAYKIDGYRFDLMGHHMLDDMVLVRESLDALTLQRDGVDGEKIYVYGEGWDFGEVGGNARGVNATQLNVGGLGIGVFNDRLRDAARGGTPFGGQQEQGFLTGLNFDTNEVETRRPPATFSRLTHIKDWILVGIAGNLANYEFTNKFGRPASGASIDYNQAPAGYTQLPQENIVYVSAHDNETLFDAIQLKVPLGTSMEERVRIQNLGNSLVMLSQGVPFFHAGDDMLRSKSMDRDSYNSGDWFNRLDFTYETNNWGAGLPPSHNSGNWPIMQPLLANPDLKPEREHILSAVAHFQEMLRIRKSSPLFRLRTAEDVQNRLVFYNTGSDQIPGLIAYSLTDQVQPTQDNQYGMIVVVVNADPQPQTFADESLSGLGFRLHPVLAESSDPVVRQAVYESEGGSFTVPGRTAAVYVTGGGSRAPLAPGVYLPLLIAAGLVIVLLAALFAQVRSEDKFEEAEHH